MSIIDKLGMKTPDELKVVGDVWKVYELAGLPAPNPSNNLFFEQGNKIKNLLDSKNEILEALIKQDYAIERQILHDYPVSIPVKSAFIESKKIIEKATSKSWKEIKQLL